MYMGQTSKSFCIRQKEKSTNKVKDFNTPLSVIKHGDEKQLHSFE